MRPIIRGVVASVAALGLLSACGSDSKVTLPTSPNVTVAAGDTAPGGASDATIPSDFSVPTAMIDQMIAQFEAAGMKVDRPCFENLLKNEELRKLVAAGNTPSPDVIAKFMACFKA
jgi:hypothetical protein